jgi:diguanylate cyclase (GGDEF)-like protein
MRIKAILESPGKLPKPVLTLVGILLVLAIGSLDTVTSYDVSVSLLYFFPIILIAWFEGRLPSIMISVFSAITWVVSDLLSGHVYSHYTVPFWNAIMMVGMFLTVAYAVTTGKKLFIKEHEHEITDDLTGVANIRSFYEQARTEISRSDISKRPLTLAYIDVDNIKQVNDIFGHIVGDYLLHEAAQIMRSTVRSTDIISRLEGAKFAILMPDTKNENATAIIYKVQERLLSLVKKHGWPAMFNIGVVTCDGTVCTLSKLIATAEDLMNAAKGSGHNMVKNRILDLKDDLMKR